MESAVRQFRKDWIGNIRFEFFTISGSLTIEAWQSTRQCRVSTYSRGVGRRTEVRLTDDQWWSLVVPVSYSGFWDWSKRYDSHVRSGYAPSWSVSIMTVGRWYCSSGDGDFPEGFGTMLKGMVGFAAAVEGREQAPVGGLLSMFHDTGQA